MKTVALMRRGHEKSRRRCGRMYQQYRCIALLLFHIIPSRTIVSRRYQSRLREELDECEVEAETESEEAIARLLTLVNVEGCSPPFLV